MRLKYLFLISVFAGCISGPLLVASETTTHVALPTEVLEAPESIQEGVVSIDDLLGSDSDVKTTASKPAKISPPTKPAEPTKTPEIVTTPQTKEVISKKEPTTTQARSSKHEVNQAPTPVVNKPASSEPPPEIFTARKNASSNAIAEKGSPRYSWKKQITTTVFWVGEPANKSVSPSCNTVSAWDTAWVKNYGGFDDPVRRKGFWPARFKPRQNPFYFALPYNDMRQGRLKPETNRIIPWYKDEYTSQRNSVCKGRWIAIEHNGKTCYAQWEDVGPFRHDHAGYVFGNEKPMPNRNKAAGLDVSPAVRDYLEFKGQASTAWRFVDDHEVPEGPWKEIVNERTGGGSLLTIK